MSVQSYLYPFDPTGAAATNRITGERQTISSTGMFDFLYIIPQNGPFFATSMTVTHYPSGRVLQEGVDYSFGHLFSSATHSIGMAIYGSITFYDHTLTGSVILDYQTLGGMWTLDLATIATILANEIRNPRITTWEMIVTLPEQFPPINHEFDIIDFYGASDVVTALDGIRQAIADAGAGGLALHLADYANPHRVTKAQVGLELVENLPLASIGEAQGGIRNDRYMTPYSVKQAIDALANANLNLHLADYNNPHRVSKAQVGLGLVENLALASQPEAEAGASNARYMTPLRVKEAIDFQIGGAFELHVANVSNPHQVTKAQVGLGNVENLPLATVGDAQSGSGNTGYMTPALTAAAIQGLATEVIQNHILDVNNPHQVTKAQVGLGQVANYPVANQQQAQDGTDNQSYMTPLMVRYAIDALVTGSFTSHTSNYENPHHVTAAQIGTMTTTEITNALASKLDSTAPAADATLAYGLTKAQLLSEVSAQASTDAQTLQGQTADQLIAAARAGTVDNANTVGGKSVTDLTNDMQMINLETLKLQAQVAALTDVNQYTYDVNGDVTSTTVITPANVWWKLGTAYLDPLRDQTLEPINLLVESGDDGTNIEQRTVEISFNKAAGTGIISLRGIVEVQTSIVSHGPQFHALVVGGDTVTPTCEIWMFDTTVRPGLTVNELSNKQVTWGSLGPITDYANLDLVGPTGATAATVVAPWAKAADLASLVSQLTTAFGDALTTLNA